MIRRFNFKRYKLSQTNIDEETGEILEDQEPQPDDFKEDGFAHGKDVIDLGNVNDIHYLKPLSSLQRLVLHILFLTTSWPSSHSWLLNKLKQMNKELEIL